MKAEMTISVRPPRHAYFIPDDDLSRFVDVASWCCTQWGGINNLIVPVKPKSDMTVRGSQFSPVLSAPIFDAFLFWRQPDIYIDAVTHIDEMDTSSDSQNVQRAYANKPLFHWDHFISPGVDDCLHPLSILPTDSTFERAPTDGDWLPGTYVGVPILYVPANLPTVPMTDFDQAVMAAAFGRVVEDQRSDYERSFILKSWPMYVPSLFVNSQFEDDPTSSVINLTLRELANFGSSPALFHPYFDVVIANSVPDLCQYWNMRALAFGYPSAVGRRSILMSLSQFSDPQYAGALEELIRTQRHPTQSANIDIFFHFTDDSVPSILTRYKAFTYVEIETLQMRMVSEKRREAGVTRADGINGTTQPLRYTTNRMAGYPQYSEYGGTTTSIPIEADVGPTELYVQELGPRASSVAKYIVQLRSGLWDQLPVDSAVAGLAKHNADLEITLGTASLAYPSLRSARGLERIEFSLPDTWDVYKSYFRARGYNVSASDKLPYANGLLGIAGGLESAGIFRSKLTFNLLSRLADRPSRKVAQDILRNLGLSKDAAKEEIVQQAIAQLGTLTPVQRRPRIFSDLRSLTSQWGTTQDFIQALATLVKIRAVQRGMYLLCPHCHTRVWYALGLLDESVRCLGCQFEFDVPVVDGENATSDRPIEYSLSPLANLAMDQDILPVVITLLALREKHHLMHHVVPGMLIKRQGKTDDIGDFDLVYIHRHNIFAGECKAGKILAEKDIHLARLAREIGARAYFFATTSQFSDDSKQLVQQFQAEVSQSGIDANQFSVHLLEEDTLFGNKPLPADIPG